MCLPSLSAAWGLAAQQAVHIQRLLTADFPCNEQFLLSIKLTFLPVNLWENSHLCQKSQLRLFELAVTAFCTLKMSSRPDVDQVRAMQASIWSTTAVAFVFLVLRFWARIYKRAIGMDDMFMLLSWVSLSPLSTMVEGIY